MAEVSRINHSKIVVLTLLAALVIMLIGITASVTDDDRHLRRRRRGDAVGRIGDGPVPARVGGDDEPDHLQH